MPHRGNGEGLGPDWRALAFGGHVDYAMLIKLYGPSLEGDRRYSPADIVGVPEAWEACKQPS